MRFGYAVVRWMSATAFRLAYGVEVRGVENVPQRGAVILAINHRSNFDPPLMGGFSPREVHFFAKEELFRNPFLSRFIRYLNAFPVRRGQFDRESLSHSVHVLKHGQTLVFFPEGTRAPADGFLKAKLGLGWVVHLSGADIVPVYIHGSVAARLKRTGRPQISIIFGQPIPADSLMDARLRGKELYQSISDQILEAIRQLSLSTPRQLVREKGPIYDRSVIPDERLR
jgi:1-acyl-sn-glycerol-3-phosphate acyltransferase